MPAALHFDKARGLYVRPEARGRGAANLPPELQSPALVTPQEAGLVTPGEGQKAQEVYGRLPPLEEYLATARAGSAKRDWYPAATRILQGLFGQNYPRFAALLAAFSPRSGPTPNLQRALVGWGNYQDWLGQRGTDQPPTEQELLGVLPEWYGSGRYDPSQLIQGGIQNTWNPNVARALTHPDPGTPDIGLLSPTGLKTDSFRRNLVGQGFPVTNDMWVAAFGAPSAAYNADPELRQAEAGALGQPGPYLAHAARYREAAQELNRQLRPGEEPWDPAAVQAAIWAASRGLANTLARATEAGHPMSPEDAVYATTKGNLLESSDFLRSLMTDPRHRGVIQRLGMEEPVETARQSYIGDIYPRLRESEDPAVDWGPAPEERQALETVARRLAPMEESFAGRLGRQRYAREDNPTTGHARPPRARDLDEPNPGVARRSLDVDSFGGWLDRLRQTHPHPTVRNMAEVMRRGQLSAYYPLADALHEAGDMDELAVAWSHAPALSSLWWRALPRNQNIGPYSSIPAQDAQARAYHNQQIYKGLPQGETPPRRFAATGHAQPMVASSSNIEQHLTFDQALQQARSGNHAQFKKLTDAVLGELGLPAQTYTGIGDWEDGAEPSVLQVLPGHTDPHSLRYAAAWHGLLGNQRSVLTFLPHPQGPDSTYDFTLPTGDLGQVRQLLSSHGVPFRTLVPDRQGTRVVIYDQGRQWRDRVAALAGQFNAPIRESTGHGDYLGSPTRAGARHLFRSIISDFEATRPGTGGKVRSGRGALLADRGSQGPGVGQPAPGPPTAPGGAGAYPGPTADVGY